MQCRSFVLDGAAAPPLAFLAPSFRLASHLSQREYKPRIEPHNRVNYRWRTPMCSKRMACVRFVLRIMFYAENRLSPKRTSIHSIVSSCLGYADNCGSKHCVFQSIGAIIEAFRDMATNAGAWTAHFVTLFAKYSHPRYLLGGFINGNRNLGQG